VNRLILARHAHALSNAAGTVNSVPPGQGLSREGLAEARALGALLGAEPIDLGISTRLRRTQETLDVALLGRDVPRVVEPLLDEIDFGSFEGRPLADYRAWAWEHPPEADCPGGGESRVDAALRVAAALEALLEQPAAIVLVISHALPIRYVLDAADGAFPASRIERVAHAVPTSLDRSGVELAARTLGAWAQAPQFVDLPAGG